MTDYKVPVMGISEGIPAKNDVLKFNGTTFVPCPEGTNFTLSIATFTHNLGTSPVTLEIGAGSNWLEIGEIIFSASYNNPPPTTATVQLYNPPFGVSAWGTALDMGSPNFTGPTASLEAVAYPTNKDTTITFRLTTTGDADTEDTLFYFRNNIRWGSSDKNTGWSEVEIEALNGSILSNDHTRSGMSVTGLDAADYVVFACPASYSNLTSVNFTYDGIVIAMTLVTSTRSIANASGFTENYDVYASDIQYPSSGNKTLASDKSQALNYLFWGSDADTSATEAMIEAMDVQHNSDGFTAGKVASNTKNRTVTFTAGAGKYVWYCYPSRLGTSTFTVGGFEGGFESPSSVTVMNVNGYSENYYCYRSTQHSLTEKVYVVT